MNDRIEQVADDVWLARGTDVNWVLVRDGSDLTLIDSGWAGDRDLVVRSVHEVGGRPEDVRAILLTHAHIDHMGALNHFHERYGTPVHTDPVEVSHAHRDRLEQAGPAAVARNIWRPGVLPWTVRVVRVGALNGITAAHATAFPTEPLDLPGAPVPVATHGHTSGHAAFYLPRHGIVVTGDGLVTGHPATGVHGPHLLGAMFNHDQAAALAALDPLERLDADTILPGHGLVHRGPIAEAISIARERANS